MSMNPNAVNPNPEHDELPAEIDFSKGVRGRFFSENGIQLNLPVYLEPQVQAYLTERAEARGIEYAQLANELLKKNIELIESTR